MAVYHDPTRLLLAVQAAGHKVFTGSSFDMNIIGVRSSVTTANDFDDRLYLVYWDDQDRLQFKSYKATTDPGLHWLKHPMRVEGTAILCPGQYRGTYKIAKHRGKYDALCQLGSKVKVYRDRNRDDVLDHDPDTVREGWYGINIHRAHSRVEVDEVNKYSAGCQVIADPDEFDDFMDTVRLQIKHHPTWTKFTYTLLEE